MEKSGDALLDGHGTPAASRILVGSRSPTRGVGRYADGMHNLRGMQFAARRQGKSGAGTQTMKRSSMNAGWLGVVAVALLGALACVDCYVQEAARLRMMDQSAVAARGAADAAR